MTETEQGNYLSATKNALGQIQGTVLVAVSGGVDSAVTAGLLRHLGYQTQLILIDSGYQREGEITSVMRLFRTQGFTIELIDARARFHEYTKGRSSSAAKRAGFRRAYFEILLEYAQQHGLTSLAQGTQAYRRSTRQVGHNTPNTQFMQSKLRLIEPVKGLHKPEIRQLAKLLGLPNEIVSRRAFPGPGLLIRFAGAYSEEKLTTIREATKIVDDFVDEHSETFQSAYQVFPYLMSGTGFPYINQHNQPALGNLLLIRAVQEVPGALGMQYHPVVIPADELADLSSRLLMLPNIARVAIDTSPKLGTYDLPQRGASIEYG